MSRLLTVLLLYKNGFEIQKYVSIERKILYNIDQYYEALSASQQGWHKGLNDPTSFVKYYLRIILSSYQEIL